MKKIKLYIATSIDGFIARNDGDLDWLTEFPNPERIDYGYRTFSESVDTILMGGHTYRDILSMDILWPFVDKPTYVITRNATVAKRDVRFITENIIEDIVKLKNEEGKDIGLVGGGKLLKLFLNQNLIDEMIITTIPIILGDGIPLFPNDLKESRWYLESNTNYNNGVVQRVYKKQY